MGLASLSIGSFASYENTSSLVYFADLLRSVGGSMVTNAAGTALEDENAARRIPVRYANTAGPRAFEESIAAKATMKRRYVVNFFISLFVPVGMILRSETSNLQHIRVSQK